MKCVHEALFTIGPTEPEANWPVISQFGVSITRHMKFENGYGFFRDVVVVIGRWEVIAPARFETCSGACGVFRIR